MVVDTEAELDKLITEWEATTLQVSKIPFFFKTSRLHANYPLKVPIEPNNYPVQVDLTTADTAKPDHTFDISGFKPANVFFLTSDREVP